MQYGRLKCEEMREAAWLSANSFADYEYFSLYIPNARRRLLFLQTMMPVEFAINYNLAELWAARESGRIIAVAMLCSPDYIKPSAMQYMKAGFGKVFLAGGIKAVSSWNAMDTEAGKPCHSRKDSWYLSLLTVDPEKKGRGIGSDMLQSCILPRVRAQGGKELTLFTNSERNREFYRKNGFTEFHQKMFSYHGKHLGSWSFFIKTQE